MDSGQDIPLTNRENPPLRRLPCLESGNCYIGEDRKARVSEIFGKNEEYVLEVMNSYIHNQRDPHCTNLAHDARGYSVLHLAAERDFLSVAEILLESEFDPLTPTCPTSKRHAQHTAVEEHHQGQNSSARFRGNEQLENIATGNDDEPVPTTCSAGNTLALHVAIEKNHDEMAALIINYISNYHVRELFRSFAETSLFKVCKIRESSEDILNLNYLIDKGFVKTILAVLDSLKDVNENGLATVHVKLLEEDGKGRESKDNKFNSRHRTVFHNLVNVDKKITTHPVIRVLINHKWSKWGRRRFIRNFILYLVSLISLTICVVFTVAAKEVKTYDTDLQTGRGYLECVVGVFVLHTLIQEVWKVKRHKCNYWKQFYSWTELLSTLSIIVVLILRFVNETAHWYVFAGAYMLWVLRIFEYAFIYSHTGAYAECLRQILTKNVIQFSLLFLVVNLVFGVVLLLVKKGEGTLQKNESVYEIWFVGLRTIIEGQPVVEYTEEGYRYGGTVIMLIFLTMTIVVLLTILIAQLSDTYASIKNDALKSVPANRVAILARFERNEWHCVYLLPIIKDARVETYQSVFEDIDLKNKHPSFSTQNELIDEKFNQVLNLLTKTDLKVQTLKSRLRQLDEKLTKELKSIKLVNSTAGLQALGPRVNEIEEGCIEDPLSTGGNESLDTEG